MYRLVPLVMLCVAVKSCLFWGSVFADATSPPIPTGHFFKNADITAVEISPDGRYIAYGTAGGLAVMDVDAGRVVSSFKARRPMEEIYRIWWVGSTRIVCNTIIRLPGQSTPYYTGDYFAVNVDGSRPRMLVSGFEDSYAYSVLGTLAGDTDRILMQRKLLRSTGVRGSRPEWLAANVHEIRRHAMTGTLISRTLRAEAGPLPNGSLYSDVHGNVRLAVGYDGVGTARYRDRNDAQWRDVSDALGAGDSRPIQPLGFKDGRDLYFLADLDGDTRALYVFHPQTDESTLVYRRDGFDIAGVHWNAARTRILGVAVEADFPTTVFLDANDPEVQRLRDLMRSFPGRGVRFVSSSASGHRVVVEANSDRTPAQYYLYDQAENAARFLFATHHELINVNLGAREPFVIRTSDGYDLHGYITHPPGATGQSPLVVLPHGGPHGVRDTWAFDPEAQFFASRGYTVLQVNFRGSAGYGKRFELAGHQQWGGRVIDDILLATEWTAKRPSVDPSRICIYGASFGGYAAIMATIRAPGRFKCVMALSGVYDLELMYGRGDIPQFPDGIDFLERVIGTDPDTLRANSPVHLAQHVSVPVFLGHGRRDERAPIQHADRLRSALSRHGNEPVWYVESSEGHGFYDEAQRIALYETMLDFLQTHAPVASVTADQVSERGSR